jgi:ligand-binding SRPBCC domain-containing protein
MRSPWHDGRELKGIGQKMKYHHRFVVAAPLARVAEFHRRASSMVAITPPLLIVRVHRAPATLGSGDEMAFTLWAGPLPLHWTARIEGVSPEGFTDRQVRGPFAAWQHRHRFERLSERETAVVDEVTAELKRHPFWWMVGALMWLGLPLLFAYRGWRTRRLLAAGS